MYRFIFFYCVSLSCILNISYSVLKEIKNDIIIQKNSIFIPKIVENAIYSDAKKMYIKGLIHCVKFHIQKNIEENFNVEKENQSPIHPKLSKVQYKILQKYNSSLVNDSFTFPGGNISNEEKEMMILMHERKKTSLQ